MNYDEKELLDDNIINPIPILQSFLLDHRSTLGNQGIIIAKLPPNFTFSTPTNAYTHFNGCNCDLLPHSILLLATKWCITNENIIIFMWMEVRLPIPCFFNCCTHVGKIIYDVFLIQKPLNYNKFCLMMFCHPICMMSCMFVLIFIPNINSILTLKIYNFDDNNSLINWFVISNISIIKLNDNKIKQSSKMQVIIYAMN